MTGTLHALASTGCTVVCRALATHDKVLPLSEVSPAGRRASRFVPDTPFASLLASRLLTDEERERLFQQQMKLILDLCARRGWDALIRDHPHSDFMVDEDPGSDSSLVRVMGDDLGPRAVLVRHPLDSFLSSQTSGFLTGALNDIDAYCRRLLRFDEVHGELPMFTYESFCTHPDEVLQRLAGVLEIPFEPGWRTKLPRIRLSGDSGRTADEVGPRPRRQIPQDLASQAGESLAFAEVCRRWGYAVDSSETADEMRGHRPVEFGGHSRAEAVPASDTVETSSFGAPQ